MFDGAGPSSDVLLDNVIVLCAEKISPNKLYNEEKTSGTSLSYLPSRPLTWAFLNLLTSYSEAIN